MLDVYVDSDLPDYILHGDDYKLSQLYDRILWFYRDYERAPTHEEITRNESNYSSHDVHVLKKFLILNGFAEKSCETTDVIELSKKGLAETDMHGILVIEYARALNEGKDRNRRSRLTQWQLLQLRLGWWISIASFIIALLAYFKK